MNAEKTRRLPHHRPSPCFVDRRHFLSRLAAIGGAAWATSHLLPPATAVELQNTTASSGPPVGSRGKVQQIRSEIKEYKDPKTGAEGTAADGRRLRQRSSLLHLLGLCGRQRRSYDLHFQSLRQLSVAFAGNPHGPAGAAYGGRKRLGQHGLRGPRRAAVLLRRPGAARGEGRYAGGPRAVSRAGRLQARLAHLHGRRPLRGLRLLPGHTPEHRDGQDLLDDARAILPAPALGRDADRHRRAARPWPPGASRSGSATC